MEFVITGRFIQGDLTRKGDKNYSGQPIPADKQGYFFAVAVPKANAAEVLNNLIAFAWGEYSANPNVQAAISAVAQDLNHPAFSLKVEDGDTYAKRNEHMAGCYVFKFFSKFEIGTYDAQNRQIPREQVYRGCYVDVNVKAAKNGNTDHTAGIYLNPNGVRMIAHGQPIVGGRSAEEMFGAAPTALPPGASATPVSPAAPMPAAAPQTPAGFPMPAPAAPTAALPSVPAGAPATAPSLPTAVPASAPVPSHPGILAGPPRIGG